MREWAANVHTTSCVQRRLGALSINMDSYKRQKSGESWLKDRLVALWASHRGDRYTEGGTGMDTRHLSVLSLAAMLVVVLVVGGSASGQEEYGAGLVAVEGCTGEAIELNGYEKRTLDLHNQTRADHGLQPLCVHP